MEADLKSRLTASATWLRGLFMLLFAVIRSVAEVVLGAVALLQFLFALASGAPNPRLTEFGGQLSAYLYQIFMFLTFNSERRPFPFSPWPESPPTPEDAAQDRPGGTDQ